MFLWEYYESGMRKFAGVIHPLHLRYWKRVAVGVCGLWSEPEPSQNRSKRARRRRTRNRREENSMQRLQDDDLDTGEWLPINAIPELTKKDCKRNPNQQSPRHLIGTSARFSSGLVYWALLHYHWDADVPAPRITASHPTTVRNWL